MIKKQQMLLRVLGSSPYSASVLHSGALLDPCPNVASLLIKSLPSLGPVSWPTYPFLFIIIPSEIHLCGVLLPDNGSYLANELTGFICYLVRC